MVSQVISLIQHVSIYLVDRPLDKLTDEWTGVFGQRPQRADVLLDTGVNFHMSVRVPSIPPPKLHKPQIPIE